MLILRSVKNRTFRFVSFLKFLVSACLVLPLPLLSLVERWNQANVETAKRKMPTKLEGCCEAPGLPSIHIQNIDLSARIKLDSGLN